MRVLATIAALLVVTLFPSPAFPQVKETPESIKLTGDLKHYHAMVAVYRQGNEEVVAELLTWDDKRLMKGVGGINSNQDPNRPWGDEFLRSGALLQTAAGLQCLNTRADERMMLHLNLAAQHLRLGSEALAPFARRWHYAISRLLRSRNQVLAAEQILETGRKDLPADPLVLYESATIEEMLATEWQSARMKRHGGLGSSFRDANALDEILQDRAARLQNARDWFRQSVATMPTAVSRLHFGRVLMMGKEDNEALLQLEGARRETTDRAIQYLATLFTAAIHERKGALDDSARAYRQAIDCFPENDVAYVALSEVLQTAGRGDEARAVLREFLNPRTERHEPWTWYFLEPRSVADERIAALFAEGRR